MKKLLLYIFLLPQTMSFTGAINWPTGSYNFVSEEDNAPMTIERYFTQYYTLKKNERWREIIRLGHKAIQACIEIFHYEAEAQIRLQLCAAFYYLGAYDKALDQALKANEIAREHDYVRLLIKSLYQTSAVYRALAHLSQSDDKKEENFRRANFNNNEAKKLYRSIHIKDPYLKAKVYYNIAALEADFPKWGDKNLAEKYYKKAIKIFDALGVTDEQHRSKIRLARLRFEEGLPKEAQQILDSVRPDIVLHRTLVHFELLQCQILAEEGKLFPAINTAQHALKHAKRLHAREEIVRIQVLIAELKQKFSIGKA
jgi:tetratricopeptide (TPR) repeat protein